MIICYFPGVGLVGSWERNGSHNGAIYSELTHLGILSVLRVGSSDIHHSSLTAVDDGCPNAGPSGGKARLGTSMDRV